jgi:glycosyltransferase involved in cell wall biosynthesis
MTKVNNCVTAVIITYNAAKYLPKCLESLRSVADEVLVCDAYSTDGTVNICAAYGVRCVQRAWEGYADAKNFAGSLAQYDFILSVDADEVLSDVLQQSIKNAKIQGLAGVYSLDRINNFYGKFMRHSGLYPDWKPRLFDKNLVQWQGDFVHETLQIQHQKPTKLVGKLWHFSIESLSDNVQKLNKYTDLEAEQLHKQGKKVCVMMLLVAPFFKFFNNYILRLGFLDGVEGFVACVLMGYGRFLRYAKLYFRYRS